MKILKLTSENVKRLTAIEITPDGNVVIIGGKNGAGKSSVLDSIAYALGGKELVPEQPIRKGQVSAKVTVDLGQYIVTRRFARERQACSCGVTNPGDMPIVGDDQQHLKDCAWHTFGEIRSVLTVKNAEGATYASPQALLDKMVGKLTFDPLEFAEARPGDQRDTLRRITNLDTTLLDSRRQERFTVRSEVNRRLKALNGALATLPKFDETVPEAPVSMTELSADMLNAQHLQHEANDVERALENSKHQLENENTRLENHISVLKDLEKQVQQQKDRIESVKKAREVYLKQVVAYEVEVKQARERVPDTTKLQAMIADAERVNSKIGVNRQILAARAEVESVQKEHDSITQELEAIDAKKREMIESVEFPVEGLKLTDEGVTFNDVPFEQASRAEQIRVSVAVGFALNPALKILLVRDGSNLDSDSLRLLAELAAEADGQVWLERVAESKDGVSVLITDGHVEA